MAAPIGNQFWKNRSKHGRKKIFSDPEFLYLECTKYFQWCDENPIYETKISFFQGVASQATLPKTRVYMLAGLFRFLGIDEVTWQNYRKRKEFSLVCFTVEQIVREQKFSGAAVDIFNAGLISKDLGLKEHIETDNINRNVTCEDPIEEMKRRGIPIPNIGVDDMPDPGDFDDENDE